MIHHAMLLIQQQTKDLNPGQTPVMTADQPLFALAKEIQWLKPDVFGENKLLVLVGDFHTEVTFMTYLGMPEIYQIHSSTTDMIEFDRE